MSFCARFSPFWFFPFGDYWDRCDVLRKSLVDAFMHSDWPPADLLIVAQAANVTREVMDVVSARYGARDYRNAIIADLERLPENLRNELWNVVTEFVPSRRHGF